MSNLNQVLDNLKEIEFKKPSDLIIQQIRNLITNGVLKPGDRLPSERALTERFGVGRGYIREALKKLEFYGILKTSPQRGTYFASIGVKALEGLISNVLDLEEEDYQSLMETRALLEIHAARLTAIRITDKQIEDLVHTNNEFEEQVKLGNAGLEEDLMFHIKISEFSQSSVLRSLISILTPEVITMSESLKTCRDGRFRITLKEHEAILQAIKNRDPDKAVDAMAEHMRMSQLQYTKSSPIR